MSNPQKQLDEIFAQILCAKGAHHINAKAKKITLPNAVFCVCRECNDIMRNKNNNFHVKPFCNLFPQYHHYELNIYFEIELV